MYISHLPYMDTRDGAHSPVTERMRLSTLGHRREGGCFPYLSRQSRPRCNICSYSSTHTMQDPAQPPPVLVTTINYSDITMLLWRWDQLTLRLSMTNPYCGFTTGGGSDMGTWNKTCSLIWWWWPNNVPTTSLLEAIKKWVITTHLVWYCTSTTKHNLCTFICVHDS